MDRSTAFRRLADVMNLRDRVTVAESVVDATNEAITRARQRVEDAEGAHAKVVSQLDDTRARLVEAQGLAAEVPADLVDEVAVDLGAKRASRDRLIAVLAEADGADISSHIDAIREAATGAGAVLAEAQAATGSGNAKGTH